MRPKVRPGVRVLLVDPENQLLLVRFYDSARHATWWAAPGGALEDEETHEHAARREVWEETGLSALDLGPWIWTREHELRVGNDVRLHQERFYYARVPHFAPSPVQLTDAEAAVFQSLRWWRPEDLASTTDELSPRHLSKLFRDLVESGPPPNPVRVGV